MDDEYDWIDDALAAIALPIFVVVVVLMRMLSGLTRSSQLRSRRVRTKAPDAARAGKPSKGGLALKSAPPQSLGSMPRPVRPNMQNIDARH